MLAIKIDIILEIIISNSSLADRGEGTSDLKNTFRTLPIKVTFHFKISWLASYFGVQGSPQRKKKRKHLCGSGEIAKKKKHKENGRQMKIGGSYTRC